MSELKQVPRIRGDQPMFLQIVKSIGSLVEEATIELSVEGLTFRGMDPSHVALIDIGIPNSCFEKWDVEQEIKFAFRVNEFQKIIQSLDKKIQVEIQIENNEMKISQKGSTTKIRLIESSATDTPLPKIPYDATILFNNIKNFKQALKQVSTVSDYLTIEANEQFVLLSGKSEIGESEKRFEKHDESLAELSVKTDSTSTYSLEYINGFMKSVTNDNALYIEYSSVKPVRFSIRPNNLGRIDFYLAPRVEN